MLASEVVVIVVDHSFFLFIWLEHACLDAWGLGHFQDEWHLVGLVHLLLLRNYVQDVFFQLFMVNNENHVDSKLDDSLDQSLSLGSILGCEAVDHAAGCIQRREYWAYDFLHGHDASFSLGVVRVYEQLLKVELVLELL